MSVIGIGNRSTQNVQSLLDMRAKLDDLQRQLGSGKKSATYAGVGLDRGLAIGLRSQLDALSSYDDTITTVGTRLAVAQTSLQQIDSTRQTVKNAALQSKFAIDATGQTADQRAAAQNLDLVLGVLNTQAGDRYLFSGSAVDKKAVETTDHILNGDGSRAGLKQVIDERQQADLGTSGLGRLVITAPTATSVSVAEDFAGSPFGFKLGSAGTTLTGASVTGPAGSPAAIAVDLGATNPNAGETVSFSLTLPDGSSQNVTLTATASTSPGPNEFTIGANSAATAANLQTSLTASIGKLANTSLKAASAIAAGNDFFNTDSTHPPQRVSGSPATATALIDGTNSDTVNWYIGEAGSNPARDMATAKADPSISVSYGMRANEQALRLTVQNIAVFAATSYSASDPDAGQSYSELQQRVAIGLNGAQGQQKVTDIEADIAGAQTTLAAAKDRHTQTNATLSDMLQQIEGVSIDQVGAQILALQTSLQASLQTTAMLYQTSILKYI